MAFFLTFHDATFHMRGPFEYPPIIARFHRVIACFLAWFRITPKNKQLLIENGQLLVDIQMGPLYERWHHERSEKRLLRFVEAVITWLNKMPHLSSRSSECIMIGRLSSPFCEGGTDFGLFFYICTLKSGFFLKYLDLYH